MSLKSNYFRKIEQSGTAYVSERANQLGFTFASSDWANLGQGAPETGFLGGRQRIENFSIADLDHSYAPVPGLPLLRQKIAEYYNFFYRKNKKSQFTADNICITEGGRAGIYRTLQTLGKINLGVFNPDYAGYKGMLSSPGFFNPKFYNLDKADLDTFKISPKKIQNFIETESLQALLFSNPNNPTGETLDQIELASVAEISRQKSCLIISDEFYSWFSYDIAEDEPLSIAKEINDVNSDPIIIIDGLTKNFRYPGWRISWVVGPEEFIQKLSITGSFINGGANRPLQKLTIEKVLVDIKNLGKEISITKAHFQKKRDFVFQKLTEMNLQPERKPTGSLYFWLNLKNLPSQINTGQAFFEEALQEKVILLPGEYFDLQTDNHRSLSFQNNIRLSYGPVQDKLELGLHKIAKILAKYS